ncbi:uncharacterized protein LOC110830032 isoform X2 [Zootermopsis nevadensis]|uniref:uncharacterized protein LOC110830032 isoform X2 n=1 Tax=Zootermopsis nevadensis TaxID=136037 RepID=UPI000B8E72B8|nr:uncharacterized protein LOC110830032 isoform X2 [Zootermopsis nevadensis]
MSRSGRNYGKKPPDIGLQMECHDEALTPEQAAAYNKGEKEYKEVTAKLEQMMKNLGAEIIEKSDSVYVVQMNNSSPPPVPALTANTPSTGKSVMSPATRQSTALIAQPPPATNAMVQALQTATGPVILQGSPQAQGVMTRASTGSTLHTPGTYQLVMDPRLGLIVGTVTSPQTTPGTPVIQNTTSLAKTPTFVSSAPAIQTRSTVNSRSSSVRMQTNTTPSTQKVTAAQPPAKMNVVSPASTPVVSSPTVPSIRIKPPKPPPNQKASSIKTPSASASKVSLPSNPIARPTEGNSVGGLSTGPGSKPWRPTTSGSVNAPLVDLTDDDGKPPSSNVADSREVTFNKLSGKTFPSLVVVARPHLRVKEMAQGTVSQERAALDAKVKSVLMFTPTKFTEWLIQQGLVRSEQYCTTHCMPDSTTPIRLKLGMYSDVSKFPYSGGYVWISECCPQRFVSVFSGSIYEGAPHPPTVLLKLIYHWACQTNVQNVVQWVKVDNFYVKNFFTNMRSICTAAIHEKYEKMGGLKKRVEVGVISLGTTSQDGNMRQVKVEVLGVMDPENKLIRLRAVEPIQEGDRNYKRRFVKILEPLEQWVNKDSIILTDFTVDKSTLHNMGFSSVYQVSISEAPTPQNKYSNQNVMEYLRRIVPRMFQNTLSLLSRQIIQQFLDELVWRERWGPVASQAFDNVIAHMAEQTKLETDDSLLMRLSRVAANPFKHWQYSSWKTAPTPKTPVVTNGTPATPPEPLPGPVSSIDMLPQSIRMVDSPTPQSGRRGRKRIVPQSDAPEPKKPATLSPSVPPVPEEQTVLDSYYYGTLEGDAQIIKEEFKNSLTIKCCVCNRKYSNNILLMKHLIMHVQSDNQFLTELSDLTQCKYCLKSFPTPFSMQTHIEEIHLKMTTSLVCRICEEKFRDRPMLIAHMHRTHIEVELPYECGICKFRSSMHRDVIDHFYEVHSGGEKLQCPFCLKTVAFANCGKKMSANVNFFLNHIQKHQRKSIARKCNKCAMWFVHKGILKEHHIKDHSSFKGVPGVKPYMNPTGVDVMMPLPPTSLFSRCPLTQKQQPYGIKSSTSFANKIFEPPLEIYGVQTGSTCCECEGDFLGEDHFPGYLTCSRCRFATCCGKAMMEHIVVFHESGKSTPEFTLGRMVQLPGDMFCVCGFQSSSGNRLANHLAKCERKSAYPSPARAKSATIQSASFPPLVTLDDADNASEDPSDRWLKAFVPSRKEEPGEGSRDAPDKKQAPQPEGGDPPSMLNILGLVRKPSTDESSLDRALSDSEGLPDGKTDRPQHAASSEQEPPKQENDMIPLSGATSEDEGKKIAEANEEKMEVDETETNSDQPVAPTSTDDSEPVEMLPNVSVPTRDALPDNSEATEMLPDESVPTEETLPDDSEATEEMLRDDSVLAEETSSDDNAPAEDISPDNHATAEDTLPDDRTSPVEVEENSQASEAEDNRPTSHQPTATADSRLSPPLEAEVRIPSPVTDSESKCSHPPGDIEESVVLPLCIENESSTEIKGSGELCQEGEQAGDTEIRLPSTIETEAVCAENRSPISPVDNEVPSLTEDKVADTPVESTDMSVVENLVPLLQKDGPLSEERKGEAEEIPTNATE